MNSNAVLLTICIRTFRVAKWTHMFAAESYTLDMSRKQQDNFERELKVSYPIFKCCKGQIMSSSGQFYISIVRLGIYSTTLFVNFWFCFSKDSVNFYQKQKNKAYCALCDQILYVTKNDTNLCTVMLLQSLKKINFIMIKWKMGGVGGVFFLVKYWLPP